MRWLASVVASLLSIAPVTAQPLPHGVPDFCAQPTITSIRAGDWSAPSTWTPARVPTPTDVVRVAHAVSTRGNAAADCVGVSGALTFADSAKLTVGTLLVYEAGALEIGTAAAPISAEIVIADKALNTTGDPEQFGTGLIAFGKVRIHGTPVITAFLRVVADPLAGQSTLTFATPTGWRVGDRIVLPDTRQLTFQDFQNYVPQWEERIVSAVAGNSVTLDRPLTYAHRGLGAPFLPHAANLTRSVVVRSVNPTGTRGHAIFLHRADVDIRYAQFKDMGRTTEQPLGPGNLIGRYPVHLHHLAGPQATPSTGYQYVLEGNVVEASKKWPIAVHNTHFGLVRGNVVYNWTGAGIATEDGSETQNVIEGNFALRGTGTGGRLGEGREGVGFWFRGTDNVVRNNVAANILSDAPDAAYGYKFYPYFLGNVQVPIAPGSLTTETKDANATPVREFTGNEAYGAIESGLTFWWVGTWSNGFRPLTGESILKNTTVWNASNKGVFVYPANKLTIDGLIVRGATTGGTGVEFSDYYARDFTLKNADIRNRIAGISGSPNTDGTTVRIEDSRLENQANLRIGMLHTVSYSAEELRPRRWHLKNVTFTLLPRDTADPAGQVVLFYGDQPTSAPTLLDEITINNERVFYTQQASTFVVPVSRFNSDGTRSVIGAPVAGLTNAQAWAAHRVAVAGAVATCSTTRPDFINAFVCPVSLTPAPPLPATNLRIR